jgi:peptidoglycan/LPS O-acetylase OafA/YrhL
VQLFFALSGFLITRILLDSKGAPGWIRTFYARRALRIFPLYYVTLAFIFFVVPHVGSLAPIAGVGSRSQVWYWLYLSNWVAPFGSMAVALPHVWSLAVEEQFYLVWPALVGAVTEKMLAWACAALVALSIVARLTLHQVFTEQVAASAAYTWTITRADAIAMGALVAILIRNERAHSLLRRHFGLLFVASIAAVTATLAVFHGLPPQGPIAEFLGLPLSGLISALIVFACVSGDPAKRWWSSLVQALRRALSTRGLVSIGKYSYAIYVFHLPVHLMLRRFAQVRLESGGIAAYSIYSAAVLAVSYLLARVSWAMLEHPFLSLKRRVPTPAQSPRRA